MNLQPIDDHVLHNQPVPGTSPGNYGRSGDGAACDTNALIGHLTDSTHTRQAQTWAGIAGIPPADIPAYFSKLTPVRLRFDTRVTNYGYKSGAATSAQAVLQAGTSVLVDNRGIPRAKCNCGNPLAEPHGQPNTSGSVDGFARNPQDAWPNFDPNRTATFSPGPPTDHLILLDLDDGTAYRRNIGSDGTNDAPVASDPACGALAQSASCGGPGPQLTPQDRAALEKAVHGLTDAIRQHDCAALFDSLSAATITQFATQLVIDRSSFLTNCPKAFDLSQQYGGLNIDSVTIVSATGAHATVSVTSTLNGQTSTEEGHLVRENGNWKFDLGAQ